MHFQGSPGPGSAHPRRMRAHVIYINALAPIKPVLGAACNGCGVCCLSEPCPAGMLVSLRRRGSCAALRWEAGTARYRCGLTTLPWLGALTRRWIAAGRGCDSDAEVSADQRLTATVLKPQRLPARGP